MKARLADLDRLFLSAERVVALPARCRPLNAASEYRRLLEAWQNRRDESPQFRYAPAAELGELRDGLLRFAEHAVGDPWAELYAARAAELACEARLAEHVGRPEFARLAAERYPAPIGVDAVQAEAWARSWCAKPAGDAQRQVSSDDARDPLSLVSQLSRALGEHRSPFRVELDPELPAAAATGDGLVKVRPGLLLGEHDVRRIVVHEVEGHVLPRQRAVGASVGLLRSGSAGSADDEEGRALLLERRAGLFDDGRARELALRHLAASAVRAGADFVDTLRGLLSTPADLETALRITLRVRRGGGLGREIVYLPALARVERVFAVEPRVEELMARGRVSVSAARVILELGEPPEHVVTRRAA